MINTPNDAELTDLQNRLRELAPTLEETGWPAEGLQACADAGVFRWFLPDRVDQQTVGGLDWPAADILRGYIALAESCLTTTFVITQYMGACKRIAGGNSKLAAGLLPRLVCGELFATVGISHLTTSRQHMKKPVLQAKEQGDDILLSGFSPWVTGGDRADVIVVGATYDDGRQILIAVPCEDFAVEVKIDPRPQPAEPARLLALTESRTGAVHFDNVKLSRDWLIDGPVEGVMQRGTGAGTGGLQTSALALGLSRAAIGFIREEAQQRADLEPAVAALTSTCDDLQAQLLALAEGQCADLTAGDVRTKANSLAVRATQAALTAAKGAGYVKGHPVGRWCNEALFFLVWSCPQPVVQANLCEFAGLE